MKIIDFEKKEEIESEKDSEVEMESEEEVEDYDEEEEEEEEIDLDVEYEEEYDGLISKTICDTLELDFAPDNICQRKKFYRQIIEHCVAKKSCKNAFLAGGGYFIKYTTKSQKDAEEIQRLRNNSTLQLYIRYGGLQANHSQDSLISLLKIVPEKIDLPDRAPSVMDAKYTYIDDREKINIVIKFVNVNFEHVLKSFTFEPCKICYEYSSDKMHLSKWFLTGGDTINLNA